MKWLNNVALSLKLKLPLSIIVIVVMTFALSTSLTLHYFTSVVQSVKDSHLEAAAQNIGESLSTRIQQAGRDMVMAASLPNVLQAIELTPILKSSRDQLQVRAHLTVLFERMLLAYGYYNAFYLVNDLGEYILGTEPTAKDLTKGQPNVIFSEAMRKSGFHVGPTLYSDRIHKPIVPIFLEMVYNGHSGALVSSLNIAKMANSAMQSVPHADVYPHIFAMEDSSVVKIAQEGQAQLTQGPWMKTLEEKPSGVLRVTIDQEEYTMGFYHVPQTDIYAVALAKKDFMASPGILLRNITLTTNTIAVAVVMLFLLYMMIPIVRDIAKLSCFAKAVTDGEADASITTERKDELGHLATSLSQMVEKLKDMVEKSEAATKAKSDFLACMSHEIRTPMNGILGMTHLALQAGPDAKQKDYLLRIDTAAKTLLGVINDILDFSKIEAEKLDINLTIFRISGVFASIRDMLEERCEIKGLQLIFSVDDAVPDVICSDPLRFAQICINLCSNAIKFTSEGQVHMHISLVEKQGQDIVLCVAVTDTGIGIADDAQEKIFESFSQADGTTTRKYGGTGLGLTISKSLVNLLGGEIQVQSEVGKGSTFSFTIRAQEASEGQLEEKDIAQVMDSPLPNLEILLVEDNEINQEIALEVLRGMGMRVTLATNGEEGIAAFEKGFFDLILMDIQMPVMDGLTATKHIRKSTHHFAQRIPIIAMTAHAMTGDREKSLAAGMNDHITKPIDIKELCKVLISWGTAKQSFT